MSKDKADATFDIDNVCEWIMDGDTMLSIAKNRYGVPNSRLRRWIEADRDRLARVLDARTYAARTWDDMAEAELRKASDAFELAKAREVAQHYRWRAKLVSPDYREKSNVSITLRNADELTDDQLASIAGSG